MRHLLIEDTKRMMKLMSAVDNEVNRIVFGKNEIAIKYKLVRRDRRAASCSAFILALAISLTSLLIGVCCGSLC